MSGLDTVLRLYGSWVSEKRENVAEYSVIGKITIRGITSNINTYSLTHRVTYNIWFDSQQKQTTS